MNVNMTDLRNTKSIGLPPIQLSEKSVFTKSGECQRCAGRRLTWLKQHWRLLIIALLLVGTGVFVALIKLYATDEYFDDTEGEKIIEFDEINLYPLKPFQLNKYVSTTDTIRSKRSAFYRNDWARLKRLARKEKRLRRSSQYTNEISNSLTSKEENNEEMSELFNKIEAMSHNASLPQRLSNDLDSDMYHESKMAFNETLYEHYKPICNNLNSVAKFCDTLRLNPARYNRTYNDGALRSGSISCDEICQECKDGSKLDEQTRKKRCRHKFNPDFEDFMEHRSASEIRTVRTKIDKVANEDNTKHEVGKNKEYLSKIDPFYEVLCGKDLETFCKAVNHYLNLTESDNQSTNCTSEHCKGTPEKEKDADIQTSTDETNNERGVIFTTASANDNLNDYDDEDLNGKHINDNTKNPSEVVDDDRFSVNPKSEILKKENHDISTNRPNAREGEDISLERIVLPTHSAPVHDITKASSPIVPNAYATPMCFLGSQVPVFRNDQPGGYANYFGALMPVPQNVMGYGYNYPGNVGYPPPYPIRPQIPSLPSHVDPYFGDRFQYPGYGVPYGYQAMPPPALTMVPPLAPAPAPCTTVTPRTGHPANSGTAPDVHIAFNYREAEEDALRAACGPGLRRCDSGPCLTEHAWCDGEVQCADASDEKNCGCSARLDQSKICDGYFDCPEGEDEKGCFGCRSTSFSCNDWTDKSPKTTCFEAVQRCNFISDCPNGRDESDCNLLTDHFDDHPTFAISHTKGFLHRNYRGTWYPVCENPYQWAQQACEQEDGPLFRAPYIQIIQVDHNHREQFLNHLTMNFVQMSTKCHNNSAVYVTCPDMDCGTRVTAHRQNLYQRTDLLSSRIKRQSRRFLNLMVNQMRNDAAMAHARPGIHGDPLAHVYLEPTPSTDIKTNNHLHEAFSGYMPFNHNNMVNQRYPRYSEAPSRTTYVYNRPTSHQNGASHSTEQETVPIGTHNHDAHNAYVPEETDKTMIDQKRGKRGEGRVVGGKVSAPAAWPWIVAMYRDGLFHCGGTIISEMWILSAAHCVDKFWKYFYEIQAGVLRRLSFSPQEQSRTVSHVIVNQYYDRSNMRNDLSLLRLTEPLKFNRWVRPACLPSPHTAGPSWWWGPPAATVCTAVGWGALQEHGPDPDHLHEVEVPIVRCKHREDRAGKEICAGEIEGGKDACQGDSGGPLLCRSSLKPGQWYLAGIVSHGEGCARRNEPGAYTRVSLYVEWIAEYLFSGDTLLPSRQPLDKCPGFSCTSGIARCLPKKRICDKIIDCLNSEDEIDCSNVGKSDGESMEIDERSANLSNETGVDNTLNAKVWGAELNGKATTPAEIRGTNSLSSGEFESDTKSGESDETSEFRDNMKSLKPSSEFKKSSDIIDSSTESSSSLNGVSKEMKTKTTSNAENTFPSSTESQEMSTKIINNTKSTWLWNGNSIEIATFKEDERDNIISTTSSPKTSTPLVESENDLNESNENESITISTTMLPKLENDIKIRFQKLNKKISAIFSEDKNTALLSHDTHGLNSSVNDAIAEENNFSMNTIEDNNHTSLNSNQSFTVLNKNKKSNISADLSHDLEPEHFGNNVKANNTFHMNNTSNVINNSAETDEPLDSGHSKELTTNISHSEIKNIKGNTEHPVNIQTTSMPFRKQELHRKDFVLIPAQLHRPEQHPIMFNCRSMKQIIPFELRCNYRLDCEDGSDENGCNCFDYILTSNPSLRCDGYIDCADGIDEVNCDICPEDYFLCKASKMCLPNSQVCDGVKHCELAEDESDCFALTNGKVMTFDLYGRPDINMFGLFTKKVSKWWEVVCNADLADLEDQEMTANRICSYLGFSGYDDYELKKIEMEYFQSRFSQEDRIVRPPEYMKTKECKALQVRCHATLNTNIEAHRLFTDPEKKSDIDIFGQLDLKGNDDFEWPWAAKIYMEGIYKCTGVLTYDWWILINEKCLQDVRVNQYYVIAVLGVGAWTQELSVDLKVAVPHSSVSMLRLQQAANVTRHVRPMPLLDLNLNDQNSEACIAVGTNKHNKTATVFLKEVHKDCGKENRCFIRHSNNHSKTCVDGKYAGVSWYGIITCLGEGGWFPAAVFEDSLGDCGFQGETAAPTLAHLRTDIKTITFSWAGPANRSPLCAGWRCDRGACVPWSRVCDGTRDCAAGEDERDEACASKGDTCEFAEFSHKCGCKADQLRCTSGKCVSKLAFGDGKKDCEDGSDEPIALPGRGAERSAAVQAVPCARYLATAAPHRLCDGNLHCDDRTDEDPAYCKCFAEKSISCKYSNTCVSPDVVCDGQRDCPYGEDEDMCIGLKKLPGMSNAQGEVMVRSHGIWYTKCFEREHHTRTELENICWQMGFFGGHAVELSAPAPHSNRAVSGQTIGVQIAKFSNVTFNNRTSLRLRNSDEPFAKAVLSNGLDGCYVLYIECM